VDRPESLPFLLPWPRLALLIRRILTSQWDDATWPFAKHELTKALKLRAVLGALSHRTPTGVSYLVARSTV
jgi:hypothetical protein